MFLSHFGIKCNFKMKRKDLIEIYVYCNRFKIIVDRFCGILLEISRSLIIVNSKKDSWT